MQSGPGDYGRDNVWLAITAGPNVEAVNAHDEVIMALTGEELNAIMIESGGPEGPNIISYMDVREMPDIYVDSMVAGDFMLWMDEKSVRDEEQWLKYVKDISTNDEEYNSIIVAGLEYEKMMQEEEARWKRELEEEGRKKLSD